MEVKEFARALITELDFRAPNSRCRETRDAIQSIKHAIEDVLTKGSADPKTTFEPLLVAQLNPAPHAAANIGANSKTFTIGTKD